ncbi:MUC1-like protein, partial [Mya arenaria]
MTLKFSGNHGQTLTSHNEILPIQTLAAAQNEYFKRTTTPETTTTDSTSTTVILPGTTTPKTTIADSTSTSVIMPGITTPDTTIANSTSTTVVLPGTTTPDTTIAESTSTSVIMPGITTPDTTIANSTSTTVILPGTTKPDTTTTDSTSTTVILPGITTPDTAIANSTSTAVILPGITTPDTTIADSTSTTVILPGITTPDTTIADSTSTTVILPGTTTPDTTIADSTSTTVILPGTTTPDTATTDATSTTVIWPGTTTPETTTTDSTSTTVILPGTTIPETTTTKPTSTIDAAVKRRKREANEKELSGSVTVSIQLQISLPTGSFNESLEGTYTLEFKDKLTQLYNTTDKFQRINIIDVKKGSIVCDYEVICKGDVDLQQINTTTKEMADQPLNFIFCENCRVDVDIAAIAHSLQAAQQKRTSNACSNCIIGERCVLNLDKGNVQCIDPCKTTDNGGCINDGVCYFERQTNSTQCRCPSSGGRFIYSGKHCEIPVEKLSLSSTYIAAIAGGTGGAIIGGVRLSYDGYPSTKREDTLKVEGKEHKIITNSLGNEMFMHQPNPRDIRRHPSSRMSSSESDYSRSRTASVYDYIDTQSTVSRTTNGCFEIQKFDFSVNFLQCKTFYT